MPTVQQQIAELKNRKASLPRSDAEWKVDIDKETIRQWEDVVLPANTDAHIKRRDKWLTEFVDLRDNEIAHKYLLRRDFPELTSAQIDALYIEKRDIAELQSLVLERCVQRMEKERDLRLRGVVGQRA